LEVDLAGAPGFALRSVGSHFSTRRRQMYGKAPRAERVDLA
jgi:hypothetical protein